MGRHDTYFGDCKSPYSAPANCKFAGTRIQDLLNHFVRMKKPLFIVLYLVIPSILFAQQWEVVLPDSVYLNRGIAVENNTFEFVGYSGNDGTIISMHDNGQYETIVFPAPEGTRLVLNNLIELDDEGFFVTGTLYDIGDETGKLFVMVLDKNFVIVEQRTIQVMVRPMKTERGTQWRTYYSLTDHLGNVRAEFVAHDSGLPELVQQTDYYPFGYTLRRNDFGSQHPNRRLFGGKELQDETLAGNTLDWYDFEARMYDSLIGRFMTTDAKEEKYYNISPYVYCLNNPMIIVDPTGDTVRYADDNSREIVERLLCKTNEDGSKNSNYNRAFAKKWEKLNKSKTNYTFSLNNDLKPELGRDINGKVSYNHNGNGYLIEFTQNKGSRIKGDGGFSPEYAALFEETFHAWDIDKGSFDVGQQTAMDEARAWQFAATAPGTKDVTTEEGVSVYSAAYTIKNMPTKWVAKMLKDGCQKRPFFDWIGKDGTIYSVAGTLIQGRPYHDLNYGKSFHQSNKILLQNFGQMDSTCYEPKNLKYFRKRLVIQNGCRKEVFSGCVEGEILFCKIVENMLVHNKENHCFFDKFCSYSILSGQANDYEPDMNRIALGPHIFVKGQVVLGKEVGEWEFRYSYKDLDYLFIIANYKNGKLDGTAKFYKPDGRLYQETEFMEGKLVLRIWYNEEGEIIYKDYYKNDKLIRTEQYAKDPRSF